MAKTATNIIMSGCESISVSVLKNESTFECMDMPFVLVL